MTEGLKYFDDNVYEDDDEYETPNSLYERLCIKYKIYPELDAAANSDNTKCPMFITDALRISWPNLPTWLSAPHSLTKEFALKTDLEWSKNPRDIMMITPANSICASFFDKIFDDRHAIYERIPGRPRFLKNGKPTKYPSRNSYFVVIWRQS